MVHITYRDYDRIYGMSGTYIGIVVRYNAIWYMAALLVHWVLKVVVVALPRVSQRRAFYILVSGPMYVGACQNYGPYLGP